VFSVLALASALVLISKNNLLSDSEGSTAPPGAHPFHWSNYEIKRNKLKNREETLR